MASNSLQSLHHHHSLLKLLPSDTSPPFSLFLKLTTSTATNTSFSLSISSTASTSTAYSISPATSTTPSTSKTFSLDLLQQHLSNQNFREADEETRRLLIVLAGEAAQKRGYVFFSEVQFISEQDLRDIDGLWRKHSNNKFGYSVQRRIWRQKVGKDFTKLFIKIRWMKKLDTEVEQHNYRSFPSEFIWELDDDTPEGHLPLTNALRGIQLLNTMIRIRINFICNKLLHQLQQRPIVEESCTMKILEDYVNSINCNNYVDIYSSPCNSLLYIKHVVHLSMVN